MERHETGNRAGGSGGEATRPARIDGRYELTAEIGRGGTGTVWEAFDAVTSEVVAVKLVSPDVLATESARRRFTREVSIATALDHPRAVRVLGHGVTSDGGYLVMERLVGTTLAALLRSAGPLPQARAIHVVAQILDAVGAAHRLGIVHRDLKPGNVMLIRREADADFVKVCDFGLAKAISRDGLGQGSGSLDDPESTSITTNAGEICGTPSYMAPEQARGGPLDGRADLYAVGVILFRAITGRLPFTGATSLAIISQHLSAPPPRPSVARADLGIFPPLENLVLRALAKDPAERPSSAEVFRADLLQIERDYKRRGAGVTRSRGGDRQGAGDDTIRTGGQQPARLPRRLRRLLVASLVVGALGLGITLGVSRSSGPGWFRGRGEHHALPPSRRQAAPPAEPPAAPPERAPPEPSSRPAAAPTHPRRRSVRAAAAGDTATGEDAATLDRAQALLAQGRTAEACARGEMVAARAPESAATWKFLGGCFMRLGQPVRARDHYRKYLLLSPNDPDAVFIQAIVKQSP
jgi:serine/threonine-protein kinase